jgi:hypothetical protein
MIAKKLENVFLRQKYWALMIYLTLFALSSAAILLMPSRLNFIRLIFGIFGYIWLPGMLLASLVGLFGSKNLGLSLVSGFLLQMLNVVVAWILYRILGVIDFYMVLTISTLLLIVVFSLLLSNHAHVPKKETVSHGSARARFENVDIYLLLSLVLYLILAVYFQQYAVQPNSDGASYMDLARNVCERGIFRSNILVSPDNWTNVVYATGGHPHMFGYFVFALFFTFGGVSLSSAKIALMFGGLLIILITFLLTRELLDRNTARLASFLVSTSAIFLTQVGLIGGPEIVSALFILLALYLVLIGTKSNKKVLWFLAALSSFVAWYAWYYNFYVFLGLFICLVAYLASLKKEPIKTNLFISILLFSSLIIDDRISSIFGLEKVGLPIPLLSLVIVPMVYLVSTRKNLKLPRLSLIIVSTLIILDFIFLSFSWASPEARAFNAKWVEVGVTKANIAADVGVLSRAFEIKNIVFYWNMYKEGIYAYIGPATILLALISLFRLEKIKETLVLAMFPLFQALMFSLLVVIDGFQPRFVIGVSIFYDILVASAIVFIATSATNHTRLNKITAGARLTVMKKQLKIDIKKLVGFLVVILLLISYVGLTFEMYSNGKNVEQSWNLRQAFGWDNAINWIQSNTSSKDILACIYGDYFAWYTNRQTVFLWPIPDKNASVLIDLIKTVRVNYLIVDTPFKSQFPDLSGLYESPSPFLGSTTAFMSQDEAGNKVIIYNVTNIAYGNLTTYTFEPEWKTLESWMPLPFYSNGNVSISQDSVEFNLTVKETPWPSVAALFTFPSSVNISQYFDIEFWVKAPKCQSATLVIYSDDQNYFLYQIQNTTSDGWVKVAINLNSYTSVYGHPNLQNVNKLGFIFGGFQVGDNATFLIRDLKFSGQEYVLK